MNITTREEMLFCRKAMTVKEVEQKSEVINKRLITQFSAAQMVMGYFPFGNEVDIRYLLEFFIAKNGFVILPKVVSKTDLRFFVVHDLDCTHGYCGIFEPCIESCEEVKDFKRVDLALIPGVCFDEQCNRIGMGMGFYDRFLVKAKIAHKNIIGVGFDFQVVKNLQVKDTDFRMGSVISEKNSFTIDYF
ncbi:MAG: 5-formyltetrahydrofolate cyclo-ligase [bacterium]|nr:5-formyltetrahydrofolate cyclo-ligase [bacterium]